MRIRLPFLTILCVALVALISTKIPFFTPYLPEIMHVANYSLTLSTAKAEDEEENSDQEEEGEDGEESDEESTVEEDSDKKSEEQQKIQEGMKYDVPEAFSGDGSAPAGRGLREDTRFFSDVELDILETLSKRREALQTWEEELEVKANLLTVTERRIDKKLAQIEEMKQEISSSLELYNQKQDEHITSLVKIYETMKPQEAARIFDEMEMPITLQVIGAMSERRAAPILARMDPKKAKQVTVELALQRGQKTDM